jgi:hypothetical protein
MHSETHIPILQYLLKFFFVDLFYFRIPLCLVFSCNYGVTRSKSTAISESLLVGTLFVPVDGNCYTKRENGPSVGSQDIGFANEPWMST